VKSKFVPRLELVLIVLMCVGFVLIAQTFNFQAYQLGLVTVIIATLLNIPVGNLPRAASIGRALALTISILAIIVAVFAIGILLVPYLAELGR
jgi:predicted PurR-regulated permease PerM